MGFKVNEKRVASFGFNSVSVGRRKEEAEAQLIALTTEGSFKITAPVAVALGIKVGEYVEFVDNIDNITNAINERNEEIMEFCEQQGIDIDTVEGKEAIHQEFDMVGIVKGRQLYDGKGNALVARERMTFADKKNYAKTNFDEIFGQAMENGDDDLKASLTRDGITLDEQIEILAAFVQPNEVAKMSGSKTFSPTKGMGFSACTFSNNRMWNLLKADIEEKTKITRIFSIDLENAQMIEVSNGFESVQVKCLLLEDSVDKQATIRQSK